MLDDDDDAGLLDEDETGLLDEEDEVGQTELAELAGEAGTDEE